MNSAFAARSSGVAITTNWMARSSPNVLYAQLRMDMIVLVEAMPLFAMRMRRMTREPPRARTYDCICEARSAPDPDTTGSIATARMEATLLRWLLAAGANGNGCCTTGTLTGAACGVGGANADPARSAAPPKKPRAHGRSSMRDCGVRQAKTW